MTHEYPNQWLQNTGETDMKNLRSHPPNSKWQNKNKISDWMQDILLHLQKCYQTYPIRPGASGHCGFQTLHTPTIKFPSLRPGHRVAAGTARPGLPGTLAGATLEVTLQGGLPKLWLLYPMD